LIALPRWHAALARFWASPKMLRATSAALFPSFLRPTVGAPRKSKFARVTSDRSCRGLPTLGGRSRARGSRPQRIPSRWVSVRNWKSLRAD
jgi:hypothetical protein